MRRGLRDVQSFCDRHEGKSLGVSNLERGNTKLSLKDVPSLCSGGSYTTSGGKVVAPSCS
jgi:hypothetical protein